jgi:hypothetical protein
VTCVLDWAKFVKLRVSHTITSVSPHYQGPSFYTETSAVDTAQPNNSLFPAARFVLTKSCK